MTAVVAQATKPTSPAVTPISQVAKSNVRIEKVAAPQQQVFSQNAHQMVNRSVEQTRLTSQARITGASPAISNRAPSANFSPGRGVAETIGQPNFSPPISRPPFNPRPPAGMPTGRPSMPGGGGHGGGHGKPHKR